MKYFLLVAQEADFLHISVLLKPLERHFVPFRAGSYFFRMAANPMGQLLPLSFRGSQPRYPNQ